MDTGKNLLDDIAAALARRVADELEPVVDRALDRRLPDLLRRAALPLYLDRAGLCAMTGWSTRKVDYLRAEGKIPFVRRGRSVLFPTAEIEAYLNEGYVPAKNGLRSGSKARGRSP